MGLFDRFFKKEKNGPGSAQSVQLVNGYTARFSNEDGQLYETELVRSAVESFARHVSKLKIESKGNARPHSISRLVDKPNPYQTTAQFLAHIATIYKVETTVLIIPIYNELMPGVIDGYIPSSASGSSVIEYEGRQFLKIPKGNGDYSTYPIESVGIMTNHQYKNELFGDNNTVLNATMNLLRAQNEGMQEAIKQGANIQFMAKVATKLREEDMKKERDRFSEFNLSRNNGTGVLMYDQAISELKQIEPKSYIIDSQQMDFIKNTVFNYFGTNEDILQNKYDEGTWNAYYEGEIEPFAIQLSQILTQMTYKDRELVHNEIILTSNRLQYASNATKLQVSSQMFDRGIFGDKDIAEIWNIKHDGENKKYIRKEYAQINNLDGDINLNEKENEYD